MIDQPEQTTAHAAQDMRMELAALRREMHAARFGKPGVLRIAVGVCGGMILYSMLGVLVTVLGWGVIAGALAGMAAKSAGTNAPVQQSPPSPTPR